jgi:5,10-methylenetetrahydromethanopterin reductase
VVNDPTLRLGIGFNPIFPVKDMTKLASKVEALGYESFWLHESLFQRDVVTYLTSALTATTTLKAGSGAVNTYTRHPVTMASTFANLSELSGGRVILGIGLGSFPTIPLIGQKIFPVDENKPLQRMKEYVRLVKEIWKGEKVNFSGKFFTVKDLQLGFKLENPIPIYIATLSPMTQRFAGSFADGAILSPTLNTVERTATMVNNVRMGQQRAKRTVDKASYMLTSFDPDSNKAKDAIRGFYFFIYQLSEVIPWADLAKYGVKEELLSQVRDAYRHNDLAGAKNLIPDTAIEALAITGTIDQALDRLKQYKGAGVDMPILMPIGNIHYAIERMAPGNHTA